MKGYYENKKFPQYKDRVIIYLVNYIINGTRDLSIFQLGVEVEYYYNKNKLSLGRTLKTKYIKKRTLATTEDTPTKTKTRIYSNRRQQH